MSDPSRTPSTRDAYAPPASLIWFGEQWLLSANLLRDAFAVWVDFWIAPPSVESAPPSPDEPFLEPARLVGVD